MACRWLEAREIINNSGTVDECYAVIHGYFDKAARSLDILPDNDSRRSQLALSEAIQSAAGSR